MRINRLLFTLGLMFLFGVQVFAQPAGYQMKDAKRLPVTGVKDQYRSSTCWSWSGLSFFEAEAMRLGKKEVPNLSPMYVVAKCYADKADRAVRMQGKTNFGSGGAFHDVTYCIEKYGIVPTEVYGGLGYGEDNHVHAELDAVLSGFVETVVSNPNKRISTAWKSAFQGIVDAYLGKTPEEFTWKGKKYTPQSFAKEVVGINVNDYVEIGSYMHHPYYEQFAIEVPDNWLWSPIYNVKLEEMKQVIDYALENNITVGWAADVSEKGFSHQKGIAIVPASNIGEVAGSERLKWEKLTESELKAQMYTFDRPSAEKEINAMNRQEAFDRQETTDDHGMHIVGYATDVNGKKYYIVKNSWADNSNTIGGYFYASEAYVLYKTISVMVHKDAIPKELRTKLKL